MIYVVWNNKKKKKRLTLLLGNQEWEGKDKQTATEHILTCHSVRRLSSIALFSTSGRIFKYRRVLILGRSMSDCKSERVNITFLVQLKKSATETFQLLNEAYGEDCMSHARVFEWYKRFRKSEKAWKTMIVNIGIQRQSPISEDLVLIPWKCIFHTSVPKIKLHESLYCSFFSRIFLCVVQMIDIQRGKPRRKYL
jgi:hypothetical protein